MREGFKGLPIGLQLIADSFQEKKLIQAAYTYENSDDRRLKNGDCVRKMIKK